MKAIIELNRKASVFSIARRQLAASGRGRVPDFRLTFESPKSLFADLTPARMELLHSLHKQGACSVYALAKMTQRNYSNVHTDVARLQELGLIERQADKTVFVPFDAIEIRFPLSNAA
jgi:predicted transcriptional regulator